MKHRTQILLEESHYAWLKRKARGRRCSLSAAVRQVLDEKIQEASRPSALEEDPVLTLAGKFGSGHGDTSARDEEILYGRK